MDCRRRFVLAAIRICAGWLRPPMTTTLRHDHQSRSVSFDLGRSLVQRRRRNATNHAKYAEQHIQSAGRPPAEENDNPIRTTELQSPIRQHRFARNALPQSVPVVHMLATSALLSPISIRFSSTWESTAIWRLERSIDDRAAQLLRFRDSLTQKRCLLSNRRSQTAAWTCSSL